jgi:hypothetical protein
MRVLTIAAALLLAACPRGPVEPTPGPNDAGEEPESDAARLTPCARACAHLREVHCRSGADVDGGMTCAATCQHVVSTRLTRLDVNCAIGAADLEAAKHCEGWGC